MVFELLNPSEKIQKYFRKANLTLQWKMEPLPQQLLKLLLLRLLRQPFIHTTHKKCRCFGSMVQRTRFSPFLLDSPTFPFQIYHMNAQSEDFTALHDFDDLWVNEFPEQWADSLRVRSSNSNKNNSYESALVSCLSSNSGRHLLELKLHSRSTEGSGLN